MSDTGNPYADTRDMYAVHAVFRREFALLPGLVRAVGAGDIDRAQIVTDHIKLLIFFLHDHHSSEDAVLWPRLLTRAPREIDPVVRLVEGHHEGIEALSVEIDGLLNTWSGSAASDDAEALAEALEQLVVVLCEHMDLEEKLVLPLVERHIFAAEWAKMVEGGVASIPPEVVPVMAGMLMYEGGQESLPPEVRAVLADAAPQAYAAYSERVHGTPTPPRSSDVVIGRPFVGVVATFDQM
jgi:hemerythrin-like domain-containing protein